MYNKNIKELSDDAKKYFSGYWFINQSLESYPKWIVKKNRYSYQFIKFRYNKFVFAIKLKLNENANEYIKNNKIYIEMAQVSPEMYNKNIFLITRYRLRKLRTIQSAIYNNVTRDMEYLRWYERDKQRRYLNPNFYKKFDTIESELESKRILQHKLRYTRYNMEHSSSLKNDILLKFLDKTFENINVKTNKSRLKYNKKNNNYELRFTYLKQLFIIKNISKIIFGKIKIKNNKTLLLKKIHIEKLYTAKTFLVNDYII